MYKLTEKKKIGSNKSFGIIFFIVFLIIAFWPLLNNAEIRVWSIFVSLIFLLASLIKPKILSPLNYFWLKLGKFIGILVSPIVMAIIFFFVVTPVGFIMKILGKDLLNTKLKNKSSYWIERDKIMKTMKRQF